MLYGVLAREGLRLSEALSLRWCHLDLGRGVVRLERTKTGEGRAWVLDEGVLLALRHFRRGAKDGDLVFPSLGAKPAERFRSDLRLAGIVRAELFERSEYRRPIRLHDLRATFITLALANGKTETWVQDRTGHSTSMMLNAYRRQARRAGELELGLLNPLGSLIFGIGRGGGSSESELEANVGRRFRRVSGSEGTEPLRFTSSALANPNRSYVRARRGTALSARHVHRFD